MFKKLLLILLLPVCLNAKIKYDKEKKMYYSTKFTKSMNAELYHCLAEFVNLLIENSMQPDINVDMHDIFNYIRDELMYDGSPEAALLYEDLQEIWKNK